MSGADKLKGRIIVIEGTDGSGKQTQTQKLFEQLKNYGQNVIKQSFPNYESSSSGPVKMYLNGELGEHANDLDAYQASALFAVDRLCTLKKLKNHYENGGVILFDRYVESNMVHQAGKIQDEDEREKFLNWLCNLEFNVLKLPKPDAVIFLDMPVQYSKNLANARQGLKAGTKRDIHEQDEEHLLNAYNAGKQVASKYGWKVVKCVDEKGKIKSIEQINEEIMKIVL